MAHDRTRPKLRVRQKGRTASVVDPLGHTFWHNALESDRAPGWARGRIPAFGKHTFHLVLTRT